MKTYNPLIAAFLAGFVLSASSGSSASAGWVLFGLITVTISIAIVSYCLETPNDSESTFAGETEPNADFNALGI